MKTEAVVLDATVMTNFGGAQCMTWLQRRPQLLLVATSEAIAEVIRQRERDESHRAVSKGFVREHSLTSVRELALFGQYLPRGFGRSEAATLAAAEIHGWVVATDDQRARRLVLMFRDRQHLTSTIGLLVALVRWGIANLADVNRALGTMVERGYRLPTADLRQITGNVHEAPARYHA